MQDRLVFLISAPRSGSTLLARMLGTHAAIHAPVEPHLMPPLAHLGLHEKVDTAPYDPVITQLGLREFVASLPRGEADWWDGLRALCDTLYGRSLEASGRKIFLDKTPAYALTLDFLTRLYPEARYLVLTRNPLAIWSSFVDSFFDGDHESAHRHNPLLERYLPAIARLLREAPVPLRPIAYEALVADPEAELRSVCAWLGIDFAPAMIEYGRASADGPPIARGLGDPVTVGRESRPTTRSLDRWAQAFAGEPGKVAQAREILARLDDDDLTVFGHPRAALSAELDAVAPSGAAPPRRRLARYALERRVLVASRRQIRRRPLLARLVRRVRSACDVLLR